MLRGSRTSLLFLLVILVTPSLFIGDLVIDTVVSSASFHPAQISDWLAGWQYRKTHSIEGAPGAGTNYQVQIRVHRSLGTDSGENVFVGTNCRADFGDIWFTDDDSTTQLDYWLEESDSTHAVFWVEVRDDLDTDQTIYVYYGNSGVSTTSDGAATFTFFDDFDNGFIDPSKWDAHGPWTEIGGLTSFSITGTGGMSILPSLRTDDTWDMRNKSTVSRWKI